MTIVVRAMTVHSSVTTTVHCRIAAPYPLYPTPFKEPAAMSDITEFGRSTIQDLANRYRLSHDAIEHMARAIANGGGTMAQFNVPELGGSGQ